MKTKTEGTVTTEVTTSVTGFQFHKKVNAALVEAGLTKVDKVTNTLVTKTIPPQMIYNYMKKGTIKTEKGLITLDEGNKFINSYITKLILKASEALVEVEA